MRWGRRSGSVRARGPDRFVGLAVLSLLSDVAEERPLICVVDDAQWLDRASSQVLGFVARRLQAESAGLVFAARASSDDLAGLPELVVEGLGEGDARALLDSALTAPLDARVRNRIVAETRGNPLALLELPRVDAGGARGPLDSPPRCRSPAASRRTSGVGSTRSVGARRLCNSRRPIRWASRRCWRAAERLGIRPVAVTPAVEAGLLELRYESAVPSSAGPLGGTYRSATLPERQQVHQALAEATDAEVDPDRRAWHRAQATPGPDEDVAEELERSAGRAQGREHGRGGGVPERAATLTPDAGRRAQPTAFSAATAKRDTGAPMRHWACSSRSRPARLTPCGPLGWSTCNRGLRPGTRRCRSAAAQRGQTARAARCQTLARETYLEALGAALLEAGLGDSGLLEAAEAARAAPPGPEPPRAVDVVLDGLAMQLRRDTERPRRR